MTRDPEKRKVGGSTPPLPTGLQDGVHVRRGRRDKAIIDLFPRDRRLALGAGEHRLRPGAPGPERRRPGEPRAAHVRRGAQGPASALIPEVSISIDMPGYVTLILVVTLGIIALIAGVSLVVATFLPGREPSRRIRDWIKACRGLEERPPRRGPSRKADDSDDPAKLT